MITKTPRLQFITCVISNFWPQEHLLGSNLMSWLKGSVKASLNSPFDKLNPHLARGIASSQLDGPNILTCLITCLVDMGRTSSICFECFCNSCTFSHFASFIRVCCLPLSGIVLLCAVMAVTKGLVTFFEISYSLGAFTESSSIPKPLPVWVVQIVPFLGAILFLQILLGERCPLWFHQVISSFIPSIVRKSRLIHLAPRGCRPRRMHAAEAKQVLIGFSFPLLFHLNREF